MSAESDPIRTERCLPSARRRYLFPRRYPCDDYLWRSGSSICARCGWRWSVHPLCRDDEDHEIIEHGDGRVTWVGRWK
jgi:hypothetical protein